LRSTPITNGTPIFAVACRNARFASAAGLNSGSSGGMNLGLMSSKDWGIKNLLLKCCFALGICLDYIVFQSFHILL
jgi:hypothetical protein